MQRLSGLLLMLAGASLGVYMYLPAPRDGAEKLAEMTRISAAPDRDARTQTSPSVAAPVATTGNSEPTGGFLTGSIAANSAANVARQSSVGTWSTVVTAGTANAPKLSSSKPGDAETRAELTRDLQRELTRVGCYGGEINGAWTASTKRAMSTFMDRVNASLPVTEPDYILLTLVQGHGAAACGTDCPAGQVASGDGRCVPQAVIAQAQRKSQREETRRAADERKAAEQARLAAADLRAAEQRQRLATAKVDVQKNAAVAAAAPEILPWLHDGQPTVGAGREAPPGMMSIGGPDPESLTVVSKPRVTVPARAAQEQIALADPADDSDTSAAAPELKAPKPRPVERPYYAPEPRASSPGLPGTKSGVTVYGSKPPYKSAQRPLLPPRKVTAVRRPNQLPVAKMVRPKVNYYASATKRGQPRPGTARYNLMQALGGIY